MKSEDLSVDDEEIIKKFLEQSQKYLIDDFYEFEIDHVSSSDLKNF